MSRPLFIHIEIKASVVVRVYEDYAEGEITPDTNVDMLLDVLDQLGYQQKLIGPDSFFAEEQ